MKLEIIMTQTVFKSQLTLYLMLKIILPMSFTIQIHYYFLSYKIYINHYKNKISKYQIFI